MQSITKNIRVHLTNKNVTNVFYTPLIDDNLFINIYEKEEDEEEEDDDDDDDEEEEDIKCIEIKNKFEEKKIIYDLFEKNQLSYDQLKELLSLV